MVLTKIKIYLDGTMLRLESTDEDFFNRSLPTGSLQILLQGQGFTFEDIRSGELICSVDSFDDVLDAAGGTYGATQDDVLTALNAFVNFKQGGGGDAVVFEEQDQTQDTTQAIYFIRHSFSGELAAGTYQIDSYQYLEILSGAGEISNGILIDSVLINDIRATYNLTEPKPLLNKYIFVHSGGPVQIDSAFRRLPAATSATCTFSNLIIKKIA